MMVLPIGDVRVGQLTLGSLRAGVKLLAHTAPQDNSHHFSK